MTLNKYNFRGTFGFFDIVLFLALGLLIVFPNSFRELKFPLFIISFLYSLKFVKYLRKPVTAYLFLGAIITVIYILVGLRGAKLPDVSTPQVLFVYAVTPVMWSFICNLMIVKYSIKTTINYIILFAFLGALTIFIGIWLYDIGRLDLLEYVIDNPNKTLTEEGVVEMKLFVYGSLIFIIPAFLQVRKLYNKILFSVLVIIFIIACVVSGRSALLLALGIGFIFFLIFNNKWNILAYILISFVFLMLSSYILSYFNINLDKVLGEFTDKVSNTENDPRQHQMNYLIQELSFFGNGHGVGTEYIRNNRFPWRYEILPLAILFRVGVIGFIVYSLPFIFSVITFIKLKKRNSIDNFMIVGLISMLIASFSNPYLESFEFNFFYVLPFIYFTHRKT